MIWVIRDFPIVVVFHFVVDQFVVFFGIRGRFRPVEKVLVPVDQGLVLFSMMQLHCSAVTCLIR